MCWDSAARAPQSGGLLPKDLSHLVRIDEPATRHRLTLTRTAKVEAGTHDLDLFLLPEECNLQPILELTLRRRISDTSIFKKPLVLVTEGFSKVAFANFDIAYRHGIRGIMDRSVTPISSRS